MTGPVSPRPADHGPSVFVSGAHGAGGVHPPAGSPTTRVVTNLLWLLTGGVVMVLGYLVAGVLFGILTPVMFLAALTSGSGDGAAAASALCWMSFRMAGYVAWPFGRGLTRMGRRESGDSVEYGCFVVFWFLLAGWWLALAHLLLGAVLCATVVGYRLGVAHLSLLPPALAPFVTVTSDGEDTRLVVRRGDW